MMELIELHELSEWILNWLEKDHYYHPFSKQKNIPIGELNDILNQIPRVDAVPVIRCKECKHWNPFWKSCSEYDDAMMPPEHFCSYAKRKEE